MDINDGQPIMGGVSGDTPVDPRTGKPYPGGKQPVVNADVGRLLEQEAAAVMDMVGGQLRDIGRLPQRPNVPMMLGYSVAEHRFYVGLTALCFRMIAQRHNIEPIGSLEPTLLLTQALLGDIVETPLVRYVGVEREDIYDPLVLVADAAWRQLFIEAPPAINDMLELVKNNVRTSENPVTVLVRFSVLCADLMALTEAAATGNMMVNNLVQETLNHMRELQYADKTPMQHMYGGVYNKFAQLFNLQEAHSDT